jgi:photosystem II stability/assembly factor-like uncharacterized protein
MKKHLLLVFSSASILAASGWLVYQNHQLGTFRLDGAKEESKSSVNKSQRAKEAMEARFDKLKDEYGNFNAAYYANAVAQANQFAQANSRAGALNLQWEELGPDNVGGRTRAILIDKRDPSHNTIYAGGVSGGMWKSTDGGNTWNLLTGWNQWLTVSCIDQASDGTIFIGTGEGLAQIIGTSFNSGSMGNGVYKLDANDNPVHISPDAFTGNSLNNNSPWAAVNRIAVNPTDPNYILAATDGGLYGTTDGGNNWSQVSLASAGITNGQSVADIKWSRDGTNIFASVGGRNKLVRSLNGGFTWERVSNTNNPGFPGTQGRIEIAIAPSNSSIVYVAIATSSGATYGVYRSADAGATWTNIGSKGPLFDPFGDQQQGWYDNVIAVSPADPNKVYMGGVDFYTWSDQTGWKLADVGLGGGDENPNYIHPDKHAITIDDANPNIMYIGCDGGIYKSVNAVSAFPFPTYTIKNRGYNVTQFYSVGAGISGEVIGGTQDNGTQYINYKGNTRMAAKRVIGGDGIYAEISHVDPRVSFGGIYFGQVLRSGNNTSSYDAFYDIKIDPQGHVQPSRCGGQKDQNAPFITPFYLSETRTAANGLRNISFVADKPYTTGDVVTLQSKTAKYPVQHTLTADLNTGDTLWISDPVRSRVLVTSNCGVWLTSDALDLSNIPKWYRLMSNMNGIPNSYASTEDGDILYVGTNGGRVYRCPNMNARCDTTTYPVGPNAIGFIYTNTSQFTSTVVASGRPIEGISVDPTNPDHVVAVVAGFSASNQPHVYESTNGGLSWTPLSNGLPNMPVYDVVVHDANTIIIGSELGIWSWDGTQWNEENNGLPRVPVYRLIEKELYTGGCKVLYIGTHGRGMWRSTTLTASGCSTVASINEVKNNVSLTDLNIFPNPVSDKSKISITVDKASDVTFRVFDMTGKLYKEFTYRNLIAGENQFDLDAANLVKGTYVLSATTNSGKTKSRLFTVQN